MNHKSMMMSACLAAMATAMLAMTAPTAALAGDVQVGKPTCTSLADDKKLSGAEKDSFIEKCNQFVVQETIFCPGGFCPSTMGQGGTSNK
jgi:hypothetical protein